MLGPEAVLVENAALALRREELEADADDLEFAGGRFTVRGTDKGMAIGEIAFAVFQGHNLPDGVEIVAVARNAEQDAEAAVPDPVDPGSNGGTGRDSA